MRHQPLLVPLLGTKNTHKKDIWKQRKHVFFVRKHQESVIRVHIRLFIHSIVRLLSILKLKHLKQMWNGPTENVKHLLAVFMYVAHVHVLL